MSDLSLIRIRGARQNNLQGFDVDLPLGKLIVVTGPSGSGKSSFAFETVYAEGQRRYVETFSPYTRQFLDRMDKPQVDAIDGIPPAIALDQHNHVKSTRSTVGTITEIQDYLKALFPRVARGSCPQCARAVHPENPSSICRALCADHAGQSVLFTFPCPPGEAGQKNPGDFFSFLKSQGYLRVVLFGKIVRTDDPATVSALPAVVDVVQDRFTITGESNSRILEAVESCLRHGQGRFTAINAQSFERHPYSTGWHCAHCDLDLRAPTPGLFSFNNPQGACTSCRGFGRIIGIDYERALPDRSMSIAGGVVRPFQSGFSTECQRDLLRHCGERGIDIDCPFEDLPQADQDFVILGETRPDLSADEVWENGGWYGVKGYFDWLESKTYKMHVRVLLSRYRSYRLCPDCNGGRYQPDTLNFRFPIAAESVPSPTKPSSLTLPEINALPLRDLRPLFDRLEIAPEDRSTALLREQIATRLRYLEEVGMGYLTLDRPSRTLSGGEMERVNLTSCLGASLVNTLFVMDEPSVGLHPRDVTRLTAVMEDLRDKGNTLLVVEHEEAVIRRADHLVDIGPGRGVTGGGLVFSGPAEKILDCAGSLTAEYLAGRKSIPVPSSRRSPTDWVRMRGIRHHNLDRVDVDVPLGVFCCITGVSGSGKSSLVHDVLYRNLDLDPSSEAEAPGFCRDIESPLDLEEVVLVDQSPLTRTPRSTPAVYLGIFDKIREMFATTESAMASGRTAAAFSFNSSRGGRCERCQGLGFEKIEMQFLSDLYLRCPECEGRRFTGSILDVKLGGKSIADVLELTGAEAIDFFRPYEKETRGDVIRALELLREVGLDYLRLGQAVNTLSGGESQRLKLVKRLLDRDIHPGRTLLIFDEPTTGLHFDDVRLLLNVFQRLVEEGHSLVVVEHNLDVIKSADYLIDLGPEAGDRGGRVIATGTPEEVARVEISHTGQFLGPVLDRAVREPSSIFAVGEETPSDSPVSSGGQISIRGAREHNLRNIDLDIPRNEMVVITGLSGSGKSTLAFDLVFAEGQRRFLDSMSPYARQFVEQMEKPDVDHISGLPPTVAIEQRITRGGGKSTVATVTEIYHFLRLLYAKLGTQFCPDCNVPVENETIAAVTERARQLLKKGRLQIFAPVVRGRKGFHTEVARWAQKKGYSFLLVDGALTPVAGFQKLERFKEHHIDVLIGEVQSNNPSELEEILRKATEIGDGTARVLDGKQKFHLFSTRRNCPGCGRSFESPDPRLFSFHSPHGWCEHCRGFGEVWRDAPDNQDFESEAERELAEERRYSRLDEGEAHECPLCHGARLNETARAVRVQNRGIGEVTRNSARAAIEWVDRLKFGEMENQIARDLIPEIRQRLRFLIEVGLDYLSLDRAAKTLSGGESQRIRLAAQLGSNLRGVLYVLDEPTIGLHQRDNERLLDSLETLREKGNSLLIVEHDEDTMRRASRIIDLGPGAGKHGGGVMATGSLAEIIQNPDSVTGRSLREPMPHPSRGARRPLAEVPWIELLGASKHNIKGLDIRIPLGRLTVVTGVSGSGKSTLVRGILLPALRAASARKNSRRSGREYWQELRGASRLGAVTEVDQSPIGKTSRSTPGTYVKVFDEIRKLYANLPEARLRGYQPGRFSFNTEGGRCETCLGQGVIKLEMSFLPTSYVPCEDCAGSRFNNPTLEILYNGRSIGDVMRMTIAEASEFFASVPKVVRPLRLLEETGLGYLQLGQPSPTLSGGEAQRIKLVSELAARAGIREKLVRTGFAGNSPFYILEEPTIGLHAADVARLLDVLHRLVDEGGTVVVIEHHLDLIAEADWVLDMGPDAGEKGGRLVCCGTPEEVASCKQSATGKVLRPLLKINSASQKGRKRKAKDPLKA